MDITKPTINRLDTDILIIGGGAAGCAAAIEAQEHNPQARIIIMEKAQIERSGCLASGINAINAYITENQTPETYLEYVKKDSHGLLRDDVVINGSDNFPTRYLINDACIISKTPLFEGAVIGFSGQVMTIIPHESACYRCLYEEPPPPGLVPSCQEAGVMGAIPGVIGLIQATEVIKWIMGKGKLLTDRLLIYNGLEMEFDELKIVPNPKCPVCGENPSIKELREDNYQTNHVCERISNDTSSLE